MFLFNNTNMAILSKSDKSIHNGGLPFFRYSKFCMFQWTGSIAIIVNGCVTEEYLYILVGIGLFLLFPVVNELCLNLMAKCCFKNQSEDEIRTTFQDPCLFPIVYSPGYNITACGLEKLHPFDSTKYKRIW